MLSVPNESFILSVFMLNVVMLNVVEPEKNTRLKWKWLIETNTLAYYEIILITVVKSTMLNAQVSIL
jgi:hypothetical protein